MHFPSIIALLAASAVTVSATLDPCTSNTKDKAPASPACSASKSSSDIQAAECSHNTRVSGTQTFAVWTSTKTNSNGIEYGTCKAYTCAAPIDSEMTAEEGAWTFFWGSGGEDSGIGTDCIKDPNTTECGCENSDGQFIPGSDSCT
ncbi:MAG: hypothetical protein MMC23_004865 [Stictis urceolatum]|nr:hypothetical protein [Stictis urceolata]